MQPLTLITFGRDAETSRAIREAIHADGRARLLTECSDTNQLLADVKRLRPSFAILALTTENSEKDFALIKKLVSTHPSTAIITAARDASPALILGSMRAGAREFLQVPVVTDEFRTVLDRVAELIANDASSHKGGRVVAVFSGKGGSGVSFFVTNLAAAMNVPTALVDLNLQAGDSASFLGLDAKYSLIDLVRNRSRLDESLITSLITPHSPKLSLIAAPIEAHEAEDIKAEDLTEVLHMVAQKFECVVLDLPHTFDPITVAALDMADDVLLLLTLDIPGIRSTKRALKVFDHLGYPREKIRVVVNRWSKNIDVELQKVENHLGEQLIGFVPNDYRKVMDSINLGSPLVQSEPASKITVEIKRIAALVSENGHSSSAQPKRGLFKSMFTGKNSTTGLELSAVIDNA